MPLDANEFLPKKIDAMVDFVLQRLKVSKVTNNCRDDYTREICHKITKSQTNIWSILEKGVRSYYVYNYTNLPQPIVQTADQLALAAWDGDEKLLEDVLPSSHLQVVNTSVLFGNPMVNAARHGDLKMNRMILGHVR